MFGPNRGGLTAAIKLFSSILISITFAHSAYAAQCARELTADVVALDQVFVYNRLGAYNPGGMIFALKDDVVSGNQCSTDTALYGRSYSCSSA